MFIISHLWLGLKILLPLISELTHIFQNLHNTVVKFSDGKVLTLQSAALLRLNSDKDFP